jgi:DHA2 family multidrug resistance protein
MSAATNSMADSFARVRSTAPNPWLIALTVAMAAFMEVLDTSIANVALRHIAGSLSAGQDEANWVLTSYLVANAVVLPVSGWLATVIGRKRFYLFCLVTFSTCSLMCGISTSLGMLVFFRLLQGASGAGLVPVAQAILADAFPPAKRGVAFAVYGIAVVFAPAVGPTLGGWITDNFSWHWVFLINVPIGALVMLASLRLVTDSPEEIAERERKLHGGLKIDYVGIALLAIGLGSLQMVLEEGNRNDWFGSRFIIFFAITSAVALFICFFWEILQSEPIVDIELFKSRNFSLANILMFMTGVVLFCTTALMPMFLQTILGYTATLAGTALTPGGFTIVLMMPVVGILIARVDARYLIALGVLLTAFGLYHTTRFTSDIDYSTAMWARIFQSLGLAFLFVPINTAGYVGVPKAKSNEVASLMSLSRNLGGSVGIALTTTMVARRAQYHQSVLTGHLSPYDTPYRVTLQNLIHMFMSKGADAVGAAKQAQGAIYAQLQRQATTLAFNDVFLILSVSFILLLPVIFMMKRNKPGEGGGGMAH